MHLLDRRDVHRGREGVVRGLAAVDVVVGVDRRLAAERRAQDLVGAVRDHLVGVHVGLGAGAGLPDHQREVLGELAVDHLLRRRARSASARRGSSTPSSRLTRAAARLTMPSARTSGRRHGLAADPEVLQAALGLRAPVAVGRHLDRAEGVGLDADSPLAGHGRTSWLRPRRPSSARGAGLSIAAGRRAHRRARPTSCGSDPGSRPRRCRLGGAAPARRASAARSRRGSSATLAGPLAGLVGGRRRASATVNCRPNSTLGSANTRIASNGISQPLRLTAEAQRDREALVVRPRGPRTRAAARWSSRSGSGRAGRRR